MTRLWHPMSAPRRAPHRLAFRLALALAIATAGSVASGQTAGVDDGPPTPDSTLPAVTLTPQILYKVLLGEMALQRQQPGIAASVYLDLAKSTRDPRLAQRAAEINVHTRQLDQALEATRLWLDVRPNDSFGRQMLANLLVMTQRTDELEGVLQRELQQAGPAVGEAMLRLNRVLARYTDKPAVLVLVDKLTLPYLNLAEARYVRAHAALAAGDALRAQNEIDEALALRPDWELGALFKSRNLPPTAGTFAFIESWLKAHPDAKDMRLTYARALVGEKRFDDARREFRSLQAQFPDNVDIAFAVGVLALQSGDTREAKEHLERVVELNLGKVDVAHYYLGQIAEDAGLVDDAMAHYGNVPPGEQFVSARVRGARLLARQSRIIQARVWLQAGRERSPVDAPKLVLAESQLLRERNDDGEAYGVLLRGLASHADDDELLYEAGLVAERLRKQKEAEDHFRRLIAVRPESPQGYNALGYSLADRNERLDEAESLIDKALALAPDDFYVLDSKGWVLFRRGRFDEALVFLRRAYAVKPEPEVAAHIGEVLWMQGNRAEAEVVWRNADQASPGNADLAATIKRFLP